MEIPVASASAPGVVVGCPPAREGTARARERGNRERVLWHALKDHEHPLEYMCPEMVGDVERDVCILGNSSILPEPRADVSGSLRHDLTHIPALIVATRFLCTPRLVDESGFG